MKDIIALLFYSRTIAHMEHLKTKSFSKHMALNTFYDEIIELADTLAEAYQGSEGVIEDMPIFGNKLSEPIDVFLEKQLNLIEKLRKTASDRSALQNIIDSIVELYLSTIYKLRNLS